MDNSYNDHRKRVEWRRKGGRYWSVRNDETEELTQKVARPHLCVNAKKQAYTLSPLSNFKERKKSNDILHALIARF